MSDISTQYALGLTVVIGVLVVADGSFQYFSTKTKTIAALTTPVSPLERIAWFLIYTFPIFISAAFVIWKCVSWVAIPIFLAAYPTLSTAISNKPTVQSDYDFIFIMAMLVMASALGAIMLGRVSFLKTMGIVIVVIVAISSIKSLMIRSLLAGKPDVIFNNGGTFTTSSVSIWQGNISKYLESSYQHISYYWLYCLPVLLLVTIYFKIKDKEA